MEMAWRENGDAVISPVGPSTPNMVGLLPSNVTLGATHKQIDNIARMDEM
jgi:hypothetical protein